MSSGSNTLVPDRRVPKPIEAMGYQPFRRFWLASVVSNTGSMMQLAALVWFVKEEWDSPFRVTIIAVIGLIPMLVSSPIGGHFADRMAKRDLMLWTVVAQTVVAIALALLIQTDNATFSALIGFSLVGGFFGSLGAPVQQAIVPELVPDRAMRNAISLNSAQFNLSRATGPLVAGLLIDLVGIASSFWVNAVSFAAIIFALLLIPVSPPGSVSKARFRDDFRDGIRYARRNRGIETCLIMGMFVSLLLAPYQFLMSVVAQDAFDVGPAQFGLMGSAFGFGSVMGAVILLALERNFRQSQVVFNSLAALAVAVILLGVVPTFWMGVAVVALAGLAFLPAISNLISAMQALTDESYRGRIMSLWMMWFGLLSPIAVLVQGTVAELTHIRVSLVATGIVALVGASFLWASGRVPSIDPPPLTAQQLLDARLADPDEHDVPDSPRQTDAIRDSAGSTRRNQVDDAETPSSVT